MKMIKLKNVISEQTEYTSFNSFYDENPREGKKVGGLLTRLARTEQEVKDITLDGNMIVVNLRQKGNRLKLVDSFLKEVVKLKVDGIYIQGETITIRIPK